MNIAFASVFKSCFDVSRACGAQEEAFGDEWREKSILEDLWKAETYRNTYQKLRQEQIRLELGPYNKYHESTSFLCIIHYAHHVELYIMLGPLRPIYGLELLFSHVLVYRSSPSASRWRSGRTASRTSCAARWPRSTSTWSAQCSRTSWRTTRTPT